MKKPIGIAAIGAFTLALISGCAVAGDDYFLSRHPNIAAADADVHDAIERMRAAQRTNNYDMGGHASRAIDLLQHARAEMSAAAEAATR